LTNPTIAPIIHLKSANDTKNNVKHKMKTRIIILSIVIVVLFTALQLLAAEQGRSPRQEKAAMANFNFQSNTSIGKYAFPLTVNSFTKDLGPPDSTVLDSADEGNTCPIGQLHDWCLKSANFAVSVLGDDYLEKKNYAASSRLFAVKKCDKTKETTFQGLWGLKLGDTDNIVKAKLDKIIKENKIRNLSLSKSSESSPIYSFLDGQSIAYQYIIKNGDLYFYFMIDKKGKLAIIVQADFDILIAC